MAGGLGPASPPTPRDWAMVALLGLIWGASFLSVELALPVYGPLTVAAARIALGAAALCALAVALGQGLPQFGRVWLFAAGMGALSNAMPFALLSWGQLRVTSGFAGITMAVVPLFTLGLAHFLVPGERLGPRRLAGFGLGLGGVALLIGPGAFAASGIEGEGVARLACIAASACYASGAIVTRRCPPVAPVALAAAALLSAAVMIVPAALLLEGVPHLSGGAPLGALVYLGLGPTALATLLIVAVVRGAGPSFLTLTNYQVPVWAVIFGLVFLGEALPPPFFGALGLILAGLWVSRGRARTGVV